MQKEKVSSNVTVSQIMTTITLNSQGGKQIVPKASFEFHTIGNLMHYHLHPYPLFGPLPIFITSHMVYELFLNPHPQTKKMEDRMRDYLNPKPLGRMESSHFSITHCLLQKQGPMHFRDDIGPLH